MKNPKKSYSYLLLCFVAKQNTAWEVNSKRKTLLTISFLVKINVQQWWHPAGLFKTFYVVSITSLSIPWHYVSKVETEKFIYLLTFTFVYYLFVITIKQKLFEKITAIFVHPSDPIVFLKLQFFIIQTNP